MTPPASQRNNYEVYRRWPGYHYYGLALTVAANDFGDSVKVIEERLKENHRPPHNGEVIIVKQVGASSLWALRASSKLERAEL